MTDSSRLDNMVHTSFGESPLSTPNPNAVVPTVHKETASVPLPEVEGTVGQAVKIASTNPLVTEWGDAGGAEGSGDLRPYQAGDGTFTEDEATGANAWGMAVNDGTAIEAVGNGTQAQGYALAQDGGVAEIRGRGHGSAIFGYAYATGTDSVASVVDETTDVLGEAFGSVFGYSYASDGGEATIKASWGMAAGFTFSHGAGSTALLSVNETAGFAQGYAYAMSGGTAHIEGSGYGYAGFAQGYVYAHTSGEGYLWGYGNGSYAAGNIVANGAGSVGRIISEGDGSFAHGYVNADGAGSTSKISPSGNGAFTQGYAYSYSSGLDVGTAHILASKDGAFAHGYAYADRGTAEILTSDEGAVAQGYAYGYFGVGRISASFSGAVAQGYAYGYGAGADAQVLAAGYGALASGYASASAATTALISSTGGGSFAVGYAGPGETISASGLGSAQFGPGTNDVANSVRVGTGPWLVGTNAAPASPVNGQIWVDGSGNVVIRSGGSNVTIA